jgi:hypothetical protein
MINDDRAWMEKGCTNSSPPGARKVGRPYGGACSLLRLERVNQLMYSLLII